MPPKITEEQERRNRRPLFVLAGFGLVLLLLVWSGYYFRMAHLVGERLQVVEGRVQDLSRVKRSLDAVESQVRSRTEDLQALVDLVPERSRWLKIVNEIRRVVPEGVWITSFAPADAAAGPGMGGYEGFMEQGFFDEGGGGMGEGYYGGEVAPGGIGEPVAEEIAITGQAWMDKVRTSDPIYQFRNDLEASPLFGPDTRIVRQPTPDANAVVRTFEIRIVLEEAAGDEEAP